MKTREFFSVLYSLSKVVYYDWRENEEKGFDARVELIKKEKRLRKKRLTKEFN